MRWKNRPDKPNYGEHRTQEAFLWKPKTIKGETRWLEAARWREMYMQGSGSTHSHDRWVPVMWLEPMGSCMPDPPTGPPIGQAPRPLNTSGKAAQQGFDTNDGYCPVGNGYCEWLDQFGSCCGMCTLGTEAKEIEEESIMSDSIKLYVETEGDTIHLKDVDTGRSLGRIVSLDIHESVHDEPRQAIVTLNLCKRDGDIATIWD